MNNMRLSREISCLVAKIYNTDNADDEGGNIDILGWIREGFALYKHIATPFFIIRR